MPAIKPSGDNDALYEKRKGRPAETARSGIYNPERLCFNPDCEVVFRPKDISHIYHSVACQHAMETEKSGWSDGDDYDLRGQRYQRLPLLPALLEEGSMTCCACASKLPRDHPEWWKLSAKGYLCVRCQSRYIGGAK